LHVTGELGFSVSAKDVALAVCGVLGSGGGAGHVIEYTGPVIEALSMEGRMTLCNMAIEAGARAGLIAPDEKTFAYVEGRPRAPKGAAWEAALAWWKTLKTDPGATYDKRITIDGSAIAPLVTWGTSPDDVVAITDVVPDPASCAAGRLSTLAALACGRSIPRLAPCNVGAANWASCRGDHSRPISRRELLPLRLWPRNSRRRDAQRLKLCNLYFNSCDICSCGAPLS
jgi:homoaconitase/3-isopropylmalate dehydratase large subunit